MAHRSGAWLGAEAGRRLATRDGVEVTRPDGVEVVGFTGYVELQPPLTEADIARLQHTFAFEFADDHRAFLAAGLRWAMGGPTGGTAVPSSCAAR